MQGSLCSHLGTTLFPSSLDHDSLASMGSNTLSEVAGSLPRRETFGCDPSGSVASGVFDSLCGLADNLAVGVGFFVEEGVELAAAVSSLPSWAAGAFGLKNPCNVRWPDATLLLGPLALVEDLDLLNGRLVVSATGTVLLVFN